MKRSRRECLRAGLVAGAAMVAPLPLVAAQANTTIRLGLWGCNPRGLALAVSALRSTREVELLVIADPDPARAARAARWWRHPAHRAGLRERVRIDDSAVLAGLAAAESLAALPLDALLLADPGEAPPDVLLQRHACLLPGAVSPALVDCLRQARARAEASGHVLGVCAPAAPGALACSGADLRAESLSAFFGAIRQGRRGDADGRVAALLAAGSARAV
ncbi:MAG: hypothetical protein IT479_08415 [Xanthomonadales bacterium]|nr:hypothetical protein [Xanthomonadales bacterium]MCC6593284.1 hypothetical protein [Xanthomonadales bacterium]MCE7930907.1 hypothetical protein [Xanthomonadales bacterium PRO6]